jgi:CysZ protein
MLLALSRAFVSLLHPRMLWLMVWPVLAALAVWIVLAMIFWGTASQWIDVQIKSFGFVQWMMTVEPLAFAMGYLSTIILIIAFIPLVLVTAVLIVNFFAMPAMLEHVAASSYPGLARLRGGSVAGSAWNASVAVVAFVVLAVVTLPLWVMPLFWPVLPVLLFAYLNQRVFRYDALSDHASAAEMQAMFRTHRSDFFLLGVIIAVLGYVPVFGFFVPVFGALAFIHYGLHRLQLLRQQPIEGEVIVDRERLH